MSKQNKIIKGSFLFSLICFCLFGSLILSAEASSFTITADKKGQPIIALTEKSSAQNSFFQNKTNILRSLALANPNTVFLASAPNQPGGILIYTKEKNKQKVQNDLNEMINIFYQKDSAAKRNFFAPAIALKDSSKIVHQSSGNYIVQDKQGNSTKKVLAPMNPDNYLNHKTNNNTAKQDAAKSNTAKKIVPEPDITKVSVSNSFLNSYAINLTALDVHNQFQKNNIFWRNQLGVTLEKQLGQRIFEAVKSPDGQKIAFIAANTDKTAQQWPAAVWNLYIVNTDGTDLTKVTSNINVTEKIKFYWSPNSKLVFFHQKDSLDNFNLFYFNIGNKQTEQITKGGDCSISRIANSSQKIAFLMKNEGRGDYNLWVIDLNKNNSQLLAKNITSDFLAWSPDGSKLLFSELSGEKGDFRILKIKVMPTDTSEAQYVGDYKEYLTDKVNGKHDYNIEWSPNSRYLVYVTAKSKEQKEIYSFDFANNTKKLLASKKAIGHLQPDYNHVLFVEKSLINNDFVLWTTDYNGENTRQAACGTSEEIVYSSDKSKVAFCANDNLWFINLKNQKMFKIFEVKKYRLGNFSVFKMNNIAWSKQGNKLYCSLDAYSGSYFSQAVPVLNVGLSLVLEMK